MSMFYFLVNMTLRSHGRYEDLTPFGSCFLRDVRHFSASISRNRSFLHYVLIYLPNKHPADLQTGFAVRLTRYRGMDTI